MLHTQYQFSCDSLLRHNNLGKKFLGNLGKKVTTDALFIILRETTTVTKHNKKIMLKGYTKILLRKNNCEIIMYGTGSYS